MISLLLTDRARNYHILVFSADAGVWNSSSIQFPFLWQLRGLVGVAPLSIKAS